MLNCTCPMLHTIAIFCLNWEKKPIAEQPLPFLTWEVVTRLCNSSLITMFLSASKETHYPYLYPECTNPELHKPNHVKFLNVVILNWTAFGIKAGPATPEGCIPDRPHLRGFPDSGLPYSGLWPVGKDVVQETCIQEKDVVSFDNINFCPNNLTWGI